MNQSSSLMDMASPDLSRIDMNNPRNLQFYSQILVFKNDLARENILFAQPSSLEQRNLQSIAHSLNLEYEYPIATRNVTISRQVCQAKGPVTGFEAPDADNARTSPPINAENRIPVNATHLDAIQVHAPVVFGGRESATGAVSASEGTGESLFPYVPVSETTSDSRMNAMLLTADIKDIRSDPLMQELASLPTTVSLKRKISERSASPTDSFPVKLHTRHSHTTETPFPFICLECAECFACQENFLRHEQIHMGEHQETNLRPIIGRSPPDSYLSDSQNINAQLPPSSVDSFEPFSRPENFDWMNGFEQSFDTPNLSRSGSIHSGASGYKEYIFDASSMHSGSQASATSAASGRRGPLSDCARAGMNAVRKAGACWRCKFLRKTCDPESPCALCPKGDKSSWEAVGCNRGSFKVPSLHLCPRDQVTSISLPDSSLIKKLRAAVINLRISGKSNAWLRHFWLNPSVEPKIEDGEASWAQKLEVRRMVLRKLDEGCKALNHRPLSSALRPLSECMLGIVWEYLDYNLSSHEPSDDRLMVNFTQLIPTAVIYQAKHESDQLIAQSLICLRSCVKALRAQRAGLLAREWHEICWRQSCMVESTADVQMNLTLYFEELSRVFKTEKPLRNKHGWWLSTFYSFCIQGIVRAGLIDLMKSVPHNSFDDKRFDDERFEPRHYLYLPVRLFIAISNSFDPLESDPDSMIHDTNDGRLPRAEDYRQGQDVVQRKEWEACGITSSADYLRRLFQDDGEVLRANQPRKKDTFESMAFSAYFLG